MVPPAVVFREFDLAIRWRRLIICLARRENNVGEGWKTYQTIPKNTKREGLKFLCLFLLLILMLDPVMTRTAIYAKS